MKIFQKLLHKIALDTPSPRQSRPPLNPPEQWLAYWEAQGQPWRREPEIDLQRQAELSQRRAIVPDVEKGMYPFKGMKLSRADLEWLLATHENGRGPINWSDESQREREGLDLRGADLRSLNLSGLPLAKVIGGSRFWSYATVEQHATALCHLEGASLVSAHLEGAFLAHAHLEKADLSSAHLEYATLNRARLRGAHLANAHLEGASLKEVHLEEAYLGKANMRKAYMREVYLENANLSDIVLSDEKRIGPWLIDARLDSVNLAVVKWFQIQMLGEEDQARQKKHDGKTKDRKTRLDEHERATRANRQLSIALQNQGLNEDAARFAYRAQVLQRCVFWFEMVQHRVKPRQRGRALGAWLFSWFLFLLAGYGYKSGRSLLAYLLVIVGFTALYLGLDGHLAWYEAVVVSMAAFHGRGFSPSTFSPGDPLSIASAIEAFVGLIIEVTFIATLTQRFFSK